MFRILCDPSSGSTELCLTEIGVEFYIRNLVARKMYNIAFKNTSEGSINVWTQGSMQFCEAIHFFLKGRHSKELYEER